MVQNGENDWYGFMDFSKLWQNRVNAMIQLLTTMKRDLMEIHTDLICHIIEMQCNRRDCVVYQHEGDNDHNMTILPKQKKKFYRRLSIKNMAFVSNN